MARDLEKLRLLKDDPVLFSSLVLKFQPFSYQESILRNESQRLVAVCGRQIGKSTIAAIKLLHFAITHPKTTSIIVSASLRQSMETFSKVQSFVESSILKKSVERMTRTQIFFKNGSRIICLPCGRYGSTLRGLTVHFAVVDEAAFIPSEVIESVIFPMLATTKGKIWLLTTPWDKAHITYKAFINWPKESVYHLPTSVNPLVTKEFLEEQRELIGEERFNQEYLAQFIDDVGSYFPMDLVRSRIADVEDLDEKDCLLYGGYDPGGKDSFAAFAVVALLPSTGMMHVRHYMAKKASSYTHFTVELCDFSKKHKLTKLLIDQTGLGGPIVEHVKELGLPAEGIDLTARMKEELLGHLRILFEQGRIIIPDDPRLIGALNCIEYQRTRSGGYSFTHRAGTYDDLAYALALACWCAKEPSRGILAKLERR